MLKDEPVLYRRAGLSDSLEGVTDTINVLELEMQRIARMYPELNMMMYNDSSWSSLQQEVQRLNWGMPVQNLRNQIKELRKKGL